MWSFVERAVTGFGRKLEYWLTGQTSYRITAGPFESTPTVLHDSQAKIVLDEVRQEMARHFRIRLRWPVMLELKRPPGIDWKATFYNPDGNLGRYTSYVLGSSPAHQIQIAPGLARARFRALLAHELTHAYQREANILSANQALREGMARWTEYHFLSSTSPREARRLLKIRHYTFGRAIHTILSYEREHGTPKTLAWLHGYESTSADR